MEGHAIPAYSAVQGLPWQGQSVAFKDGDSEKARTILEEAGWKVGKDGVRVKDGKEARLTLWYASGDSTRRDLAEAVRAMLEPVGIQISLQSGSWETVERHMHANPTLFGWGSLIRWSFSITTVIRLRAWNTTIRAITAILSLSSILNRQLTLRTGKSVAVLAAS